MTEEPYTVTVHGWGSADPGDVAAVIYASLIAAGDERPTVCFQTREDRDRTITAIVVSRYAIGPPIAVVPIGPLSPPISLGESIVLLSRIRACGEQLARAMSGSSSSSSPDCLHVTTLPTGDSSGQQWCCDCGALSPIASGCKWVTPRRANRVAPERIVWEKTNG